MLNVSAAAPTLSQSCLLVAWVRSLRPLRRGAIGPSLLPPPGPSLPCWVALPHLPGETLPSGLLQGQEEWAAGAAPLVTDLGPRVSSQPGSAGESQRLSEGSPTRAQARAHPLPIPATSQTPATDTPINAQNPTRNSHPPQTPPSPTHTLTPVPNTSLGWGGQVNQAGLGRRLASAACFYLRPQPGPAK